MAFDMKSREEKMVTLRRNQNGESTVWCDPEIADLVDALNTDTLSTIASCSGHGYIPGIISMKDGRELVIFNSFKEAKRVVFDKYPKDINGDLK